MFGIRKGLSWVCPGVRCGVGDDEEFALGMV